MSLSASRESRLTLALVALIFVGERVMFGAAEIAKDSFDLGRPTKQRGEARSSWRCPFSSERPLNFFLFRVHHGALESTELYIVGLPKLNPPPFGSLPKEYLPLRSGPTLCGAKY
jgi:hypothetical protein